MRQVLLWAGVAVGAALLFRYVLWPLLLPAFIYFPTPLSEARSAPGAWGLSGEEVRIRASDDVELHGWWIPARSAGESCATVIHFHGNGGNITHRAGIAEDLARRGFDVLVFDYRGYGASEGSVDGEGLYRDADAAYRLARDERGTPPDRIVLLGHSLGNAPAARVAATRPAAALGLVAPFTELPAVARHLYPWIPVDALGWKGPRFDALADVERLEIPVLIAAAAEDEIMPIAGARELYEAAAEPKTWTTVEGAGHNEIFMDRTFMQRLTGFFREAAGCADPEGATR